MKEKLDLRRLFGRSCAEIIERLIDIIRNMEYRDYDFFFRELTKMDDEKLIEWSRRFLDFDPIERMPEEEYLKIRPKLCVIGLANSVIYHVRGEKGHILVDLPPTEDYSSYGMILVDGEEVNIMSRKHYIVDRFLTVLEHVFSFVFSPDSDSHLCYLMAVRSNEDIDKYPVRNAWSHLAYVVLVTMERELSGNYVSSEFEPAYEETLARLFRRVLSRRKMPSWKLSDISYPLSKVEKAGKLILPEKKVSLLIDDLLEDSNGNYWHDFRLIRVRSDTLGCIIHEAGHAADDEWGLSGRDDFAPVYERFISLMSEDDDFQPMEKYGYYSDRSECFARCYEMYLADLGFFHTRSISGPYPEDEEFRSMNRNYFDKLTESLSKGMIGTKIEISKEEEAEV